MLRLALVAAAAVSVYGAGHMKPGAFSKPGTESMGLFALRDEVNLLKTEMYTMSTSKMLLATHDIISTNVASQLSRIDSIVKDSSAVSPLLQPLQESIDALHENSAISFKKLSSDVAGQLNEIKALLASKVSENKAKLASMKIATKADWGTELKKAQAASAKVAKDVPAVVKAKTDKAAKSMENKMSDVRHMFSAGPRRTHQGGGWHDFDMDRVEFDTLAPYAKKEGNRRIRVLLPGLFHIEMTYMGHSGWCHRHGKFFVDGNSIIHDYHNWSHHWHTSTWEITWYMKKNQQFWSRVYACNHAWHGTGSGTDAYDRIQIEWIGSVDQDKCSGGQCDGI